MLKKCLILLLFVHFSYSQKDLALIPKPSKVIFEKGIFILNENTKILLTNSEFQNEVELFNQYLKSNNGFELQVVNNSKSPINTIEIQKDNSSNSSLDFYKLNVSTSQIQIKASRNIGIFYAFQTLQQLLPIQKNEELKLPCLTIEDQSKFSWRGMHLDCARHFFTVDFVKKYIDYLAMYKFNTFHWHLTDDQGWRIEIKKYPKLTEVGAWRNGSMIGHYSDQKFDDKRYGGFYTQEEIKDVVAYAAQRHITIVPEIEMPGHAVAALAAYPEYSCTGGPFEVGKIWGVLDDVFCPKDETFTFLENILNEVMTLFPSEYIHIGGDECPKIRWKKCPHCQKRMKDENLKDEHELQSYFIQRIEKFVNSKGRKIIGWDEILEGGLAPNAAVMSWRGTEGGITAAKLKHFVVMSPGSHCYFDHYQGNPKNEPIAFGGYTPVEKVYAFNPTPKELTSEEAKYVLGAQANLWTEYIETPSHVEYMIFPRMLALSEVVWGTSNPDNYTDFQNRMLQHFEVLEHKGINYSKAVFDITTKVKASQKGILFELNSAKNSKNIRFTLDGTNPTINSLKYKKPIGISKDVTIKAAYFENGKQKSATTQQSFQINKATGKKIELMHQPNENYSHGGALTLVDGMVSKNKSLGKDWLGFSGKDLNATIDFGKVETINKVTVSVLESQGSWIYFPKSIEVLVSNDGINFRSVISVLQEEIKKSNGKIEYEIYSIKAQFVKIIATNFGKIPDGMPGAGSNAWLFVDEIGVE